MGRWKYNIEWDLCEIGFDDDIVCIHLPDGGFLCMWQAAFAP